MLSDVSILTMAVTQILFKITYEIAMLPITYRIVTFLKNKDRTDYFDVKTDFTPFSFKTEDE